MKQCIIPAQTEQLAEGLEFIRTHVEGTKLSRKEQNSCMLAAPHGS